MCSTLDSGGHVMPVVGIISGHAVDQRRVLVLVDLTVGEELPDRRRNRPRRNGGPSVVSHDDPFPLGQQSVCPDDLVDAVLGQRQHQVHDRERKQHIGIDEDAVHSHVQYGKSADSIASATRRRPARRRSRRA